MSSMRGRVFTPVVATSAATAAIVVACFWRKRKGKQLAVGGNAVSHTGPARGGEAEDIAKWKLFIQKISGEEAKEVEVLSTCTVSQLQVLVHDLQALAEDVQVTFLLGDEALVEAPGKTLAYYGIEDGATLTTIVKKVSFTISGAAGGAEGCNTRWSPIGVHNGKKMFGTSKELQEGGKPNRIVWESGFTGRWEFDGFAYDWEAPRKQAKWGIVCDGHHRYTNASDTELPPTSGWECRAHFGRHASGSITLTFD